MPVKIGTVEYFSTQEVIDQLAISRSTWIDLSRKRNIRHYTQVGKSRRFLWLKSDIDPLLEPVSQGEKQ